MSEPVEMRRPVLPETRAECPTRTELVKRLWQEQTSLPLFEDAVKSSRAQTLEEMIDEYIQAVYEPKTEEQSRWDDESAVDDPSDNESERSMIGRELRVV